ncbi:unnamed protein product [Amoebophrya sp. A120]|nr:unnamed protein product [Amoebophrya sp. A120]|eukprot:GSA120T00022210001.1
MRSSLSLVAKTGVLLATGSLAIQTKAPGGGANTRVRTQSKSWMQKWSSSPATKLAIGAAASLGMLSNAAAVSANSQGARVTPEENQNALMNIAGSETAMADAFHTFAAKFNKPYVSVVEASGFASASSYDSAVDEAPKETSHQGIVFKPAPGMEQEYLDRRNIFEDNIKKAIMENMKSEGSNNIDRARFGITKFMDQTSEEFAKKFLGLAVTDEAKKEVLGKFGKIDSSSPASSSTAKYFMKPKSTMKALLPSGSKDWVEAGMTTDVKDQGQCGSCWAFSTVEQLESMARIEGITSDFIGSPQELVSCDHHGDEGCNGGLPVNAYEWLEGKPLESETDYPYMSGITRQTGKCTMDKSLGEFKVVSYKTVAEDSLDEPKLVDYLLSSGPLSIGVDATQWQLYTGGMMDADQCNAEQLDHAVQVVKYTGSDDSANGPYYTVRNSWNTDWGEDGFIRLTAGEDTCMLTGMATTVDVEAVSKEGPADVKTPGVTIEELTDEDVDMLKENTMVV